MFRIALINMPFANINRPSIALTQLKGIIGRSFDGVLIDIHYLNHDFVDVFGADSYNEIGNDAALLHAGFGDWIFRQEAFPDLPDNTRAYLQRHAPRNDGQSQRLRQVIADVRPRLGQAIEEMISTYRLDSYDLVGFTSMFCQTVASLALARHLKQRRPDIVTVMGGANCEAPMGQELAAGAPQLDYVFSGPGLISFPRFVERLMRGEREGLGTIPGVFDADSASAQRGQMVIGQELDINDVVELDYSSFIDLTETRYPVRDKPVILTFETSRGCWWGERAHCTFCGLNGMSMEYRAMAPEKAHALISSLFKYAPVATQLESVDNIMPKSYVDGVFPSLRTPDGMGIFYEVKADLSERDLHILSDGGVRFLQPGIEALATSTLKLMRKGTTSFNNIAFLMNSRTYNIHPIWNLLIGFPGEPVSVYQKYLRDLPKLVHLPPPSACFPVRFDRFSPYFKEADRYGLQLHPMAFYELTYPLSKESLQNLAYFFVDQNYKAEYIKNVVQYYGPLQRAVEAWRQQWNSAQRPEVTLSRTGGNAVVRDSRSGSMRTYQLSDAAADILGTTSRRRNRSEIGNALKSYDETQLRDGLRELLERDLVFEESEMFMSLVMPEPATAPVRRTETVLA
jgi:ribosomal peptide maturation radical SAM protein 1